MYRRQEPCRRQSPGERSLRWAISSFFAEAPEGHQALFCRLRGDAFANVVDVSYTLEPKTPVSKFVKLDLCIQKCVACKKAHPDPRSRIQIRPVDLMWAKSNV
jgi:hypothetical protein